MRLNPLTAKILRRLSFLSVTLLALLNPAQGNAGNDFDLNLCKGSPNVDAVLACDQYGWVVKRYGIPLEAKEDPVIQARTACKDYFRLVFETRDAICSYMMQEAKIGIQLNKAGSGELNQESSLATVQAGYQEYVRLHKFYEEFFYGRTRKLKLLGAGEDEAKYAQSYASKLNQVSKMSANNGLLEYSCNSNWRMNDQVLPSETAPSFVLRGLAESSRQDLQLADREIQKLVEMSLRHSIRKGKFFQELLNSTKQARSKVGTFNKDNTDSAEPETEIPDSTIIDDVIVGLAQDKVESGIIKTIVEKPVAVATTRLASTLAAKNLVGVLTDSLSEKISNYLAAGAGAIAGLGIEYLVHGKIDSISMLAAAAGLLCKNLICLVVATAGEILMRQEEARKERFQKFLKSYAVPKCEKKNAACVSSHDIAREWGRQEKMNCNFPPLK